MLSPNELDEFLSGRRGDVMLLGFVGSALQVRFERKSESEILAHIPESRDDVTSDFNVLAALAHPMCGVIFSNVANEIVVQISKRHQFRSVVKIAMNHLGWRNEELVQWKFLETAGQ